MSDRQWIYGWTFTNQEGVHTLEVFYSKAARDQQLTKELEEVFSRRGLKMPSEITTAVTAYHEEQSFGRYHLFKERLLSPLGRPVSYKVLADIHTGQPMNADNKERPPNEGASSSPKEA